MAMVDEILANGTMDRMDRIEKLESLLSAATNLASPSPQPKPLMVDSETQVLTLYLTTISSAYYLSIYLSTIITKYYYISTTSTTISLVLIFHFVDI